jgi:hypothetical protein
MEPAASNQNDSSSRRSAARNPFFPMVLFSASVFILTILAMVAVIFSDPRAPVARFFDAHAGRLIIAEVIVTLIVGFLALVVDRHQNRRDRSLSKSDKPINRRPSLDKKT